MGKLLLVLSFLFLLLLPLNGFAEGNQHNVEGFWPGTANDCAHYSQVDQCQYLLCLCYAGCNIDNWTIDIQRKDLSDGQYQRCVQERRER